MKFRRFNPFMHDEPEFDVKPRPRHTHPFNWPLLVGMLISLAIVIGALVLVYVKFGGSR